MTEKRIKIILETDQAKGAAKEFNASMVNIGANADKINVSFKTTNQEINKTYDRSRQITQNITKITNDYRTIATSTATINANIANTNRSLGGLNTSLSQIAAAVGGALSAQSVIEYSDAFTIVQNQLRRTVDGQDALEASTKRIIEISRDSRSNLEETARLYTKMRVSTDEATYSADDLYRVTETISKGLAINAGSAASAQAALQQLGQAFDSGVLRGEEFNSVSEQAPIIMKALQVSLNKTQSELRELAADGQLSTDVIVKAVKDYSSVVDREFAKSNRTFGQSMEVARTNSIEFVGASKLIGESVRLAGDALVGLSENFETLQNVIAGLAVLYGARFAGTIAASTGALIVNQAAALRTTTTYSAMGLAIDKTTVSMNVAAAASAGLSRAMAFLGGPVGVVLVAAASLAFFSSELEKIKAEEAAAEIDKLIAKYKELDETGKQIEINKLERDRDALIARRAEVQAQINEAKKQPQSTGGFLATGGTDGLKSNIKNSALSVELADIEKRLDAIAGKSTALFNATLPEIKNTTPTANRKSTAPERNKELERLQKSITGGEAKADELFAGREEKSDTLNQSLTLENELIRKSLETRASLYATYGATVNDINAGYFEQQRARLELSIAEQAAREQEQLQKELAALSERRTAVQNETELTDFGRAEALRALDDQIILQKQTTEQRLTEIQDEGMAARAALDQLEYKNKIASVGQLGNTLISFGQGQSKKIFNIGKKLALAQAAISLPAAVMESFKNGGGYPWGLIPAAAMAAQGLQQINAIRNTTFDGGGGFSGVGGGGGSTSAAVPQLPQQQEQVQSLSIIGSESLRRELEEFAAADGVIPARTMLRYLNSVEGARRIGS